MPSILPTPPGLSSPAISSFGLSLVCFFALVFFCLSAYVSAQPTSLAFPSSTLATALHSPSASLDVNVTSSPRLSLYSSSVPDSTSGAPLYHGHQVPSRVQSPASHAGHPQPSSSPDFSRSRNHYPSISISSSPHRSPSSSPSPSLASQLVRNLSPATSISSISSKNTSIIPSEDEELNELSQLADVLSVRCF